MLGSFCICLYLIEVGMADIPTKSGLNKLYNEGVTKVEHVKRPMASSGKKLPVPHHGVRYVTIIKVARGSMLFGSMLFSY